MRMRILMLGHSTRTLDEFLALLNAHDVSLVVDVRSRPHSRHCPQFGREDLEAALREAYLWRGAGLGGLRKSYERYLLTADFDRALAEVLELAKTQSVALLCAEREWSHCHRRYIADHLTAVLGIDVVHLMGEERDPPTERHRLSREARVVEGRLRYDLDASGTPPLF